MMMMLVAGPRLWLSRGLRPATDIGVAVQVVIFLGVLGGLLWWLRDRPEWRLVVLGSGLLGLGLMGLRAAH